MPDSPAVEPDQAAPIAVGVGAPSGAATPDGTPDAATPDAATPDAAQAEPEPDPRPVFEGDWNSATGVEKGRHSERVRQWRARQAAEAQSRMGAGLDPHALRGDGLRPSGDALRPDADAATRSVLIGIRDDPKAHDSDRIRAAQALIALDREQQAQAAGSGTSPLVHLRHALELLAPHERLAWLQGERLAASAPAAERHSG